MRSTFLCAAATFAVVIAALEAKRFADFNGDNDPHGEYDVGRFEILGHTR